MQDSQRIALTLVEQPDGRTSPQRACPTGFTTGDGKPIRLGDVVRQTSATGYFEFIVTHKEVDDVGDEETAGYCLRGWREENAGVMHPLPRIVELSEFAAQGMTVLGNVFEQPEQYIPANTYYCYTGLRIESERLVAVRCPFWESTRHGMTHCRLRATRSLDPTTEEAYRKALAYYGSDDAVDQADSGDDFVLWDQVKSCGHSEDHVEVE